jgi:hypothetical protein
LIKFILIISLLFSNLLFAQSSDNQKYQQLLRKADTLYDQREDFHKAKQALYLFLQYNKELPEDVEGLWRLSMGYYYVGHLLKGKENRFKRKDYFSKGKKAGEKCEKLVLKPKVECYFWQATNLALLQQEKGIVSLAFSLNIIIDLLEKAKDTNANYASAGSYRTLAILYSKAPSIFGGNNAKAMNYIQKSIVLSPNEPLNIVVYAKILINEDNKLLAIQTISNFIKNADPLDFSYFESKNAFKELHYFLKHEQWPK